MSADLNAPSEGLKLSQEVSSLSELQGKPMKDKKNKKNVDANPQLLNDEELKAIQGGMTWKQFVGNQDNLGLEEEATAHHQGVWEGP